MTIIAASGLLPGTAAASSFQILEQSASRLGNAFSGRASAASDATTVFFNPAGMATFDEPRISVGVNAIRPVADFMNRGSSAATGTQLERPLSGANDRTDSLGLVPNLYYAQPLSDRLTMGMGFNAPFGLTTSYDDGWVGRYHATDSELTLLNTNLTFAYAVTDRLSLGAGINYQRIDTTLENAVDSFAACVIGRRSAGASAPALNCIVNPAFESGAPLSFAGNRAFDSSAVIQGDDEGFGADLSVHYRLGEHTRIGATWRQGVEFTLEGDADFELSEACAASACASALETLAGDIEAGLELPDTVNLSATHTLNDRWTLHGDIAWTQWSAVQEIEILNTGNGATVSTLELDYDDTFRYAAGTTYSADGPWALRFGFAYDEAPQTNPDLQSARIPDEDRIWLSAGLNYDFHDAGSIDIGYAHLFLDDIAIDSISQGSTLNGDFAANANIVGVQYNHRF